MHRKLRRLKQRQVAKLLGLHDTKYLALWEKGLSMPNARNLIKLSIIYRTFPNELYYELYVELKAELTALELHQFAHQ
jgi:transcriptional regulator with XRE-family HTH domain